MQVRIKNPRRRFIIDLVPLHPHDSICRHRPRCIWTFLPQNANHGEICCKEKLIKKQKRLSFALKSPLETHAFLRRSIILHLSGIQQLGRPHVITWCLPSDILQSSITMMFLFRVKRLSITI
jgi:hypothetical protein